MNIVNPKDVEISTLGELKKNGWKSVPIKLEMRNNLIRKLNKGEELFPGIVGYDKTVIPQLQHALLSRHDMILLGLRGQAKSRILRLLVNFLDEYMPVITGSEINDDPYHPLSKYARTLIEEKGDEAPVSWIHRSDRYAEKLATPDTSVADIIGDIDPIKAATRRLTLSDEDVINFGLIPRTNRGIFAINELPDLQPRIQVSLLNIMQERDIQIRGFNVRIPLDVLMVFSANPEDYTNRGNIITPLKDRIDSQIITHYPKSIDAGMEITRQEAWVKREGGLEVAIPHFVREIVEQTAVEARASEYIDQKSGVSARMTITAMEHIISAAERRAVINREKKTIIRVSDIYYSIPALTGKLELVYEGEQEGAINVAKHLLGASVNKVFKQYFPDPQKKNNTSKSKSPYEGVTGWFAKGYKIDLPDHLSAKEYGKRLMAVDDLKKVDKTFAKPQSNEELYSMMDFVLEALHQNSILGKDDLDDQRSFTDLVGSMLGSLGDYDDHFDE
ncbi:MAG: sigma 54-interacting transcriptional regulator [Balneolales bacterium]